MDKYENFYEQVRKAAKKFKEVDKKETVRLISHLDADGISACSIFVKLLNNENRKYVVSIVPQLNKEILSEFALENYKHYVFTDIGCGIISSMKEFLPGRDILILDHHNPEATEIPDNITIINPHYSGIDGGKEISGAGVVYYFAKEVDPKIEDIAHIAIIGAVGDIQDEDGFLKLNNEILETAIKKNKIEVKRGLRIFGGHTKPLHKALEYCTDPYIPGVTGSESGAIQFLYDLGIEPKSGSNWKKIIHLNDDEMKKLVTGIIMRRLGEESPEDVLGNIYLLKEEQDESPTKEVKEFATLLNACGRMGKASLGIGACLGDQKIKDKAIRNMSDYKKQIIDAINWYNGNKYSENIIEGEGHIIINAKDNVMHTIIGTLASILSKSKEFNKNTFILSMAQVLDGTTKISLRFNSKNENMDLREILKNMTANIEGCESGGHHNAAGATIPTERESEFIESAKNFLQKLSIEERIG